MAEAAGDALSPLLAAHTTLRVGGPARRVLAPATEAELVATVRDLDAAGEPVLVLGGGSNLLVGDDGFDGTVVKVVTRGIEEDVAACSGAVLTVAAGEPWESLVRHTLEHEQVGLEALAGIPGSVGGTPIQNVGAYGTEVGQLITTVRTLDRRTGAIRTFFALECRFGYRSSVFKSEPGRHLVLSVTFQLRLGSLSAPVRYPELARALGVAVGERAPAREVAEAVLALRRGKGMVLDDADPDTWSAGSFFTNPVLDPERADALPADAPRFPQPDGRVKTSAAWLIERAGYGRGFGEGPARVSSKHSLALTNRGRATAGDLLHLARQIRAGVESTYGITLVPEPVLVGCEL
ncbi:UDP-N-acetylmuramate dehydrogenase [Microlunatus capsulatus]|uniref:UDP-N-acetylenolpyruvoylglucosamine reductase n=1 Tax=Microlunatus capsulatus TaxID=99117 RepID=A0ABS4Z8S1_9ACTN|nr:UDP-N-acetylmuramate dehydrogenase [Microlunatus capsulatus]MBP2416623.1 UDP-N-acetylmuramate dehydrogenase [Microlunatus capsulatus]